MGGCTLKFFDMLLVGPTPVCRQSGVSRWYYRTAAPNTRPTLSQR